MLLHDLIQDLDALGAQVIEATGLRRAGLYDPDHRLLILSKDHTPRDIKAACREIILLEGQPVAV